MKTRELKCPCCGGPVRVSKVTCPECDISVEGAFSLPRVAMLAPDEAAFLAEYALAGFSIKELERRVGMSYPAIRARLNRIIESMRRLSAKSEKRKSILDKVEKGEIRADQAIQLIEKL